MGLRRQLTRDRKRRPLPIPMTRPTSATRILLPTNDAQRLARLGLLSVTPKALAIHQPPKAKTKTIPS